MDTKTKKIIWLIVLWQTIAVLLMAIGVWPTWVVWLNLGLIAAFIAATDPFDGLLLLIASIPFYVVLPNRYLSSLPMWRVLFVWLFLVWAARWLITFWQQRHQGGFGLLRRLRDLFLDWDKYLGLFLLITLLSLVFAHFKFQAIKQILFLINIFLLYIVLVNTATTKQRIVDVIKFSAASTTIILLLGYIQFIATLFSSPFYFWQYWAVMISRLYYGQGLSDVLIYSNSWFSYTPDGQTLRMFSIMPDSHSFAMIAVLCMGFCLPFISQYQQKHGPIWKIVTHRSYYLWYIVRFAGLAVILSGTRGIWVGMIPTLAGTIYLYIRKFARGMMKKIIIAQLLIILFFALSPAINYGLQVLRAAQYKENFLDRARSIYDLSEESNVGRLIIWKDSLAYSVTHPFGVGYGNFIVSLATDIPPGATFQQVSEHKNLRYNLPQKFVSAHSQYLNLLVELGLAGVLAFLLLFWQVLLALWRFISRHKPAENVFTMMVLSMAVVYVWFLAYGVFDVTLFNDRVLIYFFISLGTVGLILRHYDSFGDSDSIKK